MCSEARPFLTVYVSVYGKDDSEGLGGGGYGAGGGGGEEGRIDGRKDNLVW